MARLEELRLLIAESICLHRGIPMDEAEEWVRELETLSVEWPPDPVAAVTEVEVMRHPDRVIRSYVLDVDERQTVRVPYGAIPLSLYRRYDGKPELFALVDPTQVDVEWTVLAVTTDVVSGDIYGAHYLGSIYRDMIHWHYFYTSPK